MRKKYIIAYIIIVVLIATIILIINYANKNSNKDGIKGYTKNEEFYSDKIFPENVSLIEIGYDGEKELVDLYKKIYKLVNVTIHEINNINSNNDLEIYYQNNKGNMVLDFDISTYKDFEKFAKSLKIENYTNTAFVNSEIIKESIIIRQDCILFDLKVLYENGEEITFETNFSKDNDGNIKFKIAN